MATEVYTTEVFRLLDDTEVEVRPLSIAKLRKFTRMWTEHIKTVQEKLREAVEAEEAENDEELEKKVDTFDSADLTDAQYDVFIKLCAFSLETQLKGDKTEKKFLEYLEDVLDEATIYRILEVSGNLKLGPEHETPNQMDPAAVAAALGGTN